MKAITKKKIKNFASKSGKFAGKWTLKGIVKGGELIGRGTLKTLNAIVKSPELQQIFTASGMLAASVMIPTVGVGMIAALGVKFALDRTILDNQHKWVLEEVGDMINLGNTVTKSVSNKVLSPLLTKMDKGLGNIGKNTQSKIDGFGIFR